MKKILELFTVIISIQCYSQGFPNTQLQGNGHTLSKANGAYENNSGYVFVHPIPETAQANLGWLKNIPGIVIRVIDTIFIRSNDLSKWIPSKNTSDGGGGGGWSFNGDKVRSVKWLGSIDNYDVLFRPNSVEQMRVLASGGIQIPNTLSFSTTKDTYLSRRKAKWFSMGSTTTVRDSTGNFTLDTLGANTEIRGKLNVYTNRTVLYAGGNSITKGTGCTFDSIYVNRISHSTGLTLNNQALSGSGVWSATNRAYININPGHSALETEMASFNDARRGGSSRKTLNKILNAHKAMWLNHFMESYLAANSGDVSIIKSGTWHNYNSSSVGGKVSNGAYTTTSGDYIEYSFNGNGIGVGLIAFDSANQLGAKFLVSIDSVSQTGYFSENQQTDGISDGVYDNQRGQMALVFTGLSNGTHTLRLTSNQSTNLFAVDYFAILASVGSYPPLVWFAPPKMNATGYALEPANATNAIMDTIKVKLDSLKSALPAGYQLYLVNTNTYYNVNTGLSEDNIHPNDLGQSQIYSAYLAILPDYLNLRITH